MKSQIYNRLISSKNIYLAIYSINSSSLDEYLLSEEDYVEFKKLIDKFNTSNIYKWIDKIRDRIIEIINIEEDADEKYFIANVYFNPKKENAFRPLHSAPLLDQLAMICMLNILIYDIDDDKIKISEIGNLLPNDFYGNRVEKDPKSLFKPWIKQYKEYSDEANILLKKYRETGEFKYELVLDLKNFFPSINPVALNNYIVSLIPLYYSVEDKKCLEKIIEKLIFVKVKNLKTKKEKQIYYNCVLEDTSNKVIDDSEKKKIYANLVKNSFSLGLAQGLPHTYFFANLFMIKIKGIYREVLTDPKMIFYVDDSIIYTNGKFKAKDSNKELSLNKTSEEEFINVVNDKIDNLVLYFATLKEFDQKKYIVYDNIYKVRVHSFKGKDAKSFYSKITDYSSGEINISKLGREISYFSTNQNKSFDEESDNIMNIKALGLLELINNELDRVKETKSDSKSTYKDKLLRAKKFLQNRTKLIKYMLDGDKEGIIKKFDNELNEILTIKEISVEEKKELQIDNSLPKETIIKKIFCERYRNSTLASDFKYIITDSLNYDSNITEVLNKFALINQYLFGSDNRHTSYLYKLISIAKKNEQIFNQTALINKYSSLNSFVKYNLGKNYGKSAKTKLKNLDKEFNYLFEVLQEYDSTYIMEHKNKFLDYYIFKMNTPNHIFSEVSSYVNSNSDELFRMLVNAIVSYITQIEITDDFIFCKKNHMQITYFELRLLTYLRSKDFKLLNFKNHYDDCRKKQYEKIVEYSIFQVMQIFQKYIQDSKKIDVLILTHKYTSDIWKNGSKQLYFYTLHNQEHAIELIKNSIKLTKAIDLMQIKSIDYYILFLACYLHDISMVTMPNYNQFQKENFESDYIYSEFQKDFQNNIEKNIPISNNKRRMKDLYLEIDSFFEKVVRCNHGRTSAKEILDRSALTFIEEPIREMVSQVALAHVMNESDVYKEKSVATDHIISLKYLKILLRLSDVLDMGNNRVSNLLLSHNLENMSKLSRFHWLSHSITNEYKIETSYRIIDRKLKETGLFIDHNICEKIIITVPVNLFQYTKCKKPNSADYPSFYVSKLKKDEFELSFDTIKNNCAPCTENKNCNKMESCKTCNNCIFLCKWFVLKNKYLIKELYALQEYLQSIPNNMFLTKIIIRVKSENPEILGQKQFSYLKNFVNSTK